MFQSTFPRGERRQQLQVPKQFIKSFNPRSREGNDVLLSYTALQALCFNPRSREGNDIFLISSFPFPPEFQSTFPRGERQSPLLPPLPFLGFNPRSREGNDMCFIVIVSFLYYVSIHVPARGTTVCVGYRYRHRYVVSIHVPARGTTSLGFYLDYGGGFQSTFPRGERRSAFASLIVSSVFQSTFPRGERQFKPNRAQRRAAVSIHVPARGTTWCNVQYMPYMQ